MAQTAAYQLQKTDIRINSVCPGLIETGMTTETFDFARQRGTVGKVGQLNALGRFGVAEGHSITSRFEEIWLNQDLQRSRILLYF